MFTVPIGSTLQQTYSDRQVSSEAQYGREWTLPQVREKLKSSIDVREFKDYGAQSVYINGVEFRKTTSYWEDPDGNTYKKPVERDLWDPEKGELVTRKLGFSYANSRGKNPDVLLPLDSKEVELATVAPTKCDSIDPSGLPRRRV